MAEVTGMPVDTLENSRDTKDNDGDESKPPQSTEEPIASSPPLPPSPPARRRERDSLERREHDHYERERSPLPPPPRGRDYKRRSSVSPPPPPLGYRDRRHSPPPRRSPPYKKSRREDGGYEGRRGSPRGGFGHGDRRFGHDYAGGYDRDMGGRLGYPDERPHGRYIGRDWDSGRGGYGNGFNTGTNQSIHSELEDDILPAEAERRYQEYKSEYISTQKRAFFDTHKAEEWFRDKYHPTNLVSVIERRNELSRKVAKDFLLDLHSGRLDLGPGIHPLPSNKPGQTSGPNSEDDTETGRKRKQHGRVPAKETDLSAAPKAHPVSSEPRRIQVDVEQAQALVRKLDSEKGIRENILSGSDNDKLNREKSHGGSTGPVIILRGLTSVKGLEGVELLDTLITYLWHVHGLDYYGMIETAETKGFRHVRAEMKSSDTTNNGAEWEKKIDSRWQERLRGQDPLEVMTAKDKIDAAAVEGLEPYVRKIRDEKYGWKYGCGAKGCTKLFHATEFVHKHLKLKHTDLVSELTSVVREELFFRNYMIDQDAPGGKPVMQQRLRRDRSLRSRLGPENRFRNERGNPRDRDNRANGGNRYDGSDNPQSSDAPDGANHDDPMFDAFGGQGMHVGSSFSSDIPPPVLMPVPGAGPLGPFVPAPPEVAMQVFRERSGPNFKSGGCGRGPPGPGHPLLCRQAYDRIPAVYEVTN